jgi:hypothetical protein
MFTSKFLARSQTDANINAGGSSPARQSRMFQRRATRSRRLNPSLPATQLVGADLMNRWAETSSQWLPQ